MKSMLLFFCNLVNFRDNVMWVLVLVLKLPIFNLLFDNVRA